MSQLEVTATTTGMKRPLENGECCSGDAKIAKNLASEESTSKQISTTGDKSTTVHEVNTKREKQDKFIYGNYSRYYGKRSFGAGKKDEQSTSAFNDIRLQLFDREWFENKRVLDIGCNCGLLTIEIGRRFAPTEIVGIDIDAYLIGMARKSLARRRSNDGHLQNGSSSNTSIKFVNANYVLADDNLLQIVRPEYDVILALSLTKWIHLNWGDAGLRRFFKRIFRQLLPGGILIMEPQPWSTYKKRRGLSESIYRNYNSIQLKPEQFNDYLLSDEIGFESCRAVSESEKDSKGFARPMYLFRKPTAER